MKNNWQIKKIGEVCKLQGGFAFKSVDYKREGIPLIRIQNLQNDLIDIHKAVYISKERIKEYKNFILCKNDILIAMSGATTGKMAKVLESDLPLLLNQRVGRFVINNDLIDNNYLWYFLNLFKNIFLENAYGGAQPNISPSKIENLEIPLPPLKTQKEIVAKLDEKFVKLKEVKEMREMALADTEKILSQTLHEIFDDGKKKGWEERKLLEITQRTETVDPKKKLKTEFSYIDIGSVSTQNSGFIVPNIIHVNKAPSRARKLVLINDTIFATTRPYLKNIAFITENLSGSIASTGFCVIRPNQSIVDSGFLFQIVNSDYFVNKIIPFQKGATYPAVSDGVIFQQSIPLPPLSEQKEIFTQLDKLSEKICNLKELQKTQLEDLKKLEKSYLREAFNGELI